MNIKKHIPNTITSMNLLSGVLGVIMTFKGQPVTAFYLMLAASCFDFLDGFSARMLGAYSPKGKELDSLSDMVSFGVLPSIMLFWLMESHDLGLWSYAALLVAVFSALRLAKFNVDDRQKENFIGLPTPSSAMICGSLVCLAYSSPESCIAQLCATTWFIPLLSVVLSGLLVSELPMFGMKIKKGAPKDNFTILRIIFFAFVALAIVAVVLTQVHFSAGVLAAFAFYVLGNIVSAIAACFK